jgi:peptidoglycan-associated lipoprotein
MREVGRLGRAFAAIAALGLLAACVTERPVVEATGAPVGAGVNVPAGSNEDFIVNVGRRIYFDEGSAEINDVAKATLQKQADWLARYTRYKIKVEGFADDRGTLDTNKALGLRRADAARGYLASLGVPAARMRTKTFGNLKERLVNDCNEASCRAQNRRVVTVLEQETGI